MANAFPEAWPHVCACQGPGAWPCDRRVPGATDEFLAQHAPDVYLHHIDYTGRYLIKP